MTMNEVIDGALLKCFAHLCVYYVLTQTLHCTMTNHSYTNMLFDYPCDINHQSAANI